MINYEDTSHKVLGLALANGDLDVSNLSIISTKSVGNIEFGVLGASHYVKFRNGAHTLTEVFACRKLEGNMTYYPLETLVGQDFSTQTQSFDYSFNLQLVKDKKFIEKLIEQFADADTKKDGETLLEIFPTKEEPAFKACTYIHVKEHEKFTRVQTIHAYPEEEIIVYTESKIKLK